MASEHNSLQDDYYNLGTYHRKVTTTSPDAQRWFDRGLIWTYAFNHEEAATCFQNAVSHDTNCAMVYWGLAYTLGPNYNKPWQFFDGDELAATVRRTHQAARDAKKHASAAEPVEEALIDAVQYRYPQDRPRADCSSWNQGYADAMQSVYVRFPDDLDVAALYADSLMNLTPWELWDLRTGRPAPKARTLEAKEVLDRALASPGGLQHPGLLHLYIHLMEMSAAPEKALVVADHLRGLVPDAGHLNHMPTHLDILCGDYRRAISSNSEAIRSDKRFVARAGPVNFYTLYRSHNYHFRIYAAMFAGQSKVALDTAAELESQIPEELLRIKSPPMVDWLEGFLAMKVHVLIRFGRWEDLICLERPHDPELYAMTIAMMHYGKGVAFAATGKVDKAAREQRSFLEAFRNVPSSRMLFNNTCVDILAIAAAMLDGELEYRRGNIERAFKHLQRAIELDDGLPYDEPWGWMQPTRHAYGALLLEQGRIEEASAVYSADLGMDDTLPRALQHPNNVWSLHGYHECLVKLGRTAEASIVKEQLKFAAAAADIQIQSSCFCRRETPSSRP
ncbi:TPR domain protein [Aspergillus lucknowensis]|uniref:TPR domain protein n=1 Tax=Aspergillus lucknowensis TaxID=176173 RepID=A0ABR4LV59_9EURO